MKFTSTFRALTTAGLLTMTSAMAYSAPLTSWNRAGDISQNTQLGTINLGQPSYLLGTASVDFAEDAPLAAGAWNLSGQNPLDFVSLTSAIGVPDTLFDDEAHAQSENAKNGDAADERDEISGREKIRQRRREHQQQQRTHAQAHYSNHEPPPLRVWFTNPATIDASPRCRA